MRSECRKPPVPSNRNTASKRKSTNSIPKTKTKIPENEESQQSQPTPLPYQIHIQPQGPPAIATAPTGTPPSTDISVVHAPRLKAAFNDVEKYLADHYGTPTSALTYKNYANGAILVSTDKTLDFALILLNTSEGLKNLPDNVMILGYVNSANGSEWLIGEVGSFLSFLKSTCEKHKIQHLALAFSTDKPDHPATVKDADITCIRLC